MKGDPQYKQNNLPPYRENFAPNHYGVGNMDNNDNTVDPLDKNKLDEPMIGKVDQYYYYPDSDLETIVEESSVMDSDEEASKNGDLSSRRTSTTSSLSSLKFDQSPRSTNNFQNFVGHKNSLSPRQPSNYIKSPTTEKSKFVYTNLSPRTPTDVERLNSFSPDLDNDSGSSFNTTSVNPHLQQKIVYAKCLTPRNEHSSSHTPTNNNFQPPTIKDMFEAAKLGNVSALDTFSASELNDTVDEQGNTLLHVAAEFGQLSCLQKLVSTSPSRMITLPNDDLMTPTAMAIKYGYIECVQWLIKHTAAREELSLSKRPASIDGSTTRPPVAHVASRFNQVEILDWLCDEMVKDGISMDAVDHCSNTPVHVAARYGHLHCVQTLVSRGASVTVLNSNGDTPVQAAQTHGHTTCVGYLVVVETCVSLAQQLVALRNDMEVLSGENEKLRNGLLAQNISQNKPKPDLKISEPTGNNPNISPSEIHRNVEHTTLSQNLKEQPPAPKLWSSNKVQNQKESLAISARNIEKPVTNKNTNLKPPQSAIKPTSKKLHQIETDANDEVKMINKNNKPATKKAWENLTMDEMLKMVRDIRYQPSPSISLCTEDSTMEPVEIMRERMAAASRWFLVEKASGGKPIRPKQIQTNVSRTVPKNVGNLSLQQKISNHYNNSSSSQEKPPEIPNNRKKPSGSSQTLPTRVNINTYTGQSYTTNGNKTKTRTPKLVEDKDFGSKQHKNMNGTLNNSVSKKNSRSQKKIFSNKPAPITANSVEDSPPSTPTSFDTSQRSGSYRKAVIYTKPTKNLNNSSESLSSSSNTDSSNTLRGDTSDTHSIASSLGTNSTSSELKSPNKVVYFKPVVLEQSDKVVTPRQPTLKTSSYFFGSSSKNNDNQIKRPVPIRSNLFGKKKQKNLTKAPAWSVEKTLRDLTTFSPINSNPVNNDDPDKGEVPELKTNLKQWQPSFLRKVEGKHM